MKIMPGDILGFLGNNLASEIINVFTYGWPGFGLSHVAMVSEDGLLFEATSLNRNPCIIQKKIVEGMQVHHIEDSIDGYCGKIWHYPLERQLRKYERELLYNYLIKQIGKGYDFIGAFRAGGEGFSWLESKLHKENLHKLFCSEVCAAAHRECGRFETANAGKWNPNSFTREERRRGTLKKAIRLK